MRVIKDIDTRKQEILDAAIRVFAKKGYDKTSISDIAKEASMSQGLCYRYYPSKEAIYDAAIDEYAEYIASQNLNRFQFKGENLKSKIRKFSGQDNDFTDVEKEKVELYELFHKSENKKLHDQLYLKVAYKLVPSITIVLEEAKKRGEIQISDPEAMAYFFIFGQMAMLMNHGINEEDKQKRIQDCLIELLEL